MTKKLITISVFLALVVILGFGSAANAAYDDVTFSADTVVNITGTTVPDLQVESGGKVATFVTGADNVTITLLSGSDITFRSASGKIMSVDCASGSTFTAGAPSRMRVVYNTSCPTVVLTIGEGTLTEANVAASPLTAGTASAYTVTFRTVNALASNQKLKLEFGGSFTITDSTTSTLVTTLTDDGTNISSGISLSSVASSKTITITLGSAVTARSVINIVLSSALVTNPSIASADTSVSGIDIYTMTAGGTTIDSLPNQTAFNRVIDLVPGWNIFAPSQALENSAYATVLAPISGSYSAVYTLAWATTVTPNTMTWQTPTTIEPLTGYAIYITGSATKKLPLDFAQETPSNSVFSRNLDHKGWYIIGFTGTDPNGFVAQTYGLDGLTVSGNEQFSAIVDLTGTATGTEPTSHAFGATTITEIAAVGTATMLFVQDYGYAIFTVADSLVLAGEREEAH